MTEQRWEPVEVGTIQAPGGITIYVDEIAISMAAGDVLLAIAEWPDENIRLCKRVEKQEEEDE